MSGEEGSDALPIEVGISPEPDMMAIDAPNSVDLNFDTKVTLDPLNNHKEGDVDPKLEPEESCLDNHALSTDIDVDLPIEHISLEATIVDGEILYPKCNGSNVDAIPGEVSPGSIASTGLAVGDVILSVGEAETSRLTHNQCQNHLQAAGNLLQLHIAKGGSASPSITSPQPDQVATPSHPTMTACPQTSLSSGVHDLFRDMYRQSSQPSSNQNYSSRPPPVQATPSSLSPAPSLASPSSGMVPSANRHIPVQVHHDTPNVVYKGDYTNGQGDYPTSGKNMGRASEGPSCMSPPPPSYNTIDRDAYRVPSSPIPHTPGSMRTPSHPNTPVKVPQSPGNFSKTPQSPVIGPGRIAASIIDLARRSSYPYAFPPSQATTPSSAPFPSSPSHGGPGIGRQQRYPQTYNQNPASSNRTPSFSYQAHDYNHPKPQSRPRFSNAPDAKLSLPDGASGSEDQSFPTPPPEAARPAFPDSSCGLEPGTPGILPPPPPPLPPPFPQSPQPTYSSSPSLDSNKQKYATRLNQQLAGMDNYSTSPGHFPDVQPDYNAYNNYNNADNDYYNNADNGYPAPKAPPLPSPQANYRSQPTPPPQAMPDKVLNMAAKGGPDKKPFSYVPDADMLKEHRDRVRRRKPSGPDITQSATYKMIHGLDEPPPTTPSQGRRPMEGTQTTHPHACAQASTCDVINNNGDVCHTNGQSGLTPTSTNHPISLQPAVSGMYPGRPSTRQGLSFMVLQYLYDNDSNQDVTSQGSDSGQVTSDSGHVTSEMTSESASTSPGSSSVPSTPGSLSPTSPHSFRHPSYRRRAARPVRQPSQDDELSFSGVGRDAAYDHIPSRAFHKLQSLTGGSEVDRSSIRGNVAGVSAKPTRRHLRRAESAPQYQEDDDDKDGGVDLSYVGASIPSRSFRMLQQSIGADPSDYDSGVTNGMQDPLMVGPSDGSQPTPEAQARAARERRRRRRRGSLPRQVSSSPIRRPVLPREQPHEARPSDFDEEAYLAGRVPIVRSEDELQARPVVTRSRPARVEPDDEIPPENLRDFDEKAFLAGQVSLVGDPDSCNLPPRVPKKKEFSVKPDWARTVQRKKKDRAFERSTSQVADDRRRELEKASMQYINVEDEPQREFDEKAYLHGHVPIMDDTPKAPRPIMQGAGPSKQPYEFQQLAQRRASIDFQDPLKKAMEEAERLKVEEEDARNQEPFDESAFLQGRVPLVSGEENPTPIIVPDKTIPKEIPTWVKKAPQADPDMFDERAYLGGRMPLVGGGNPDMRPVNRPRKKKPKPEPEPEPENQEPFDERAFLAGQIPILGGSMDASAPPRQPKKPVEKTFAPWERQDTSDDHPDENAEEFDERQFLQGRVPVVRGSAERDVRAPRQEPSDANQRIPSKTFIRLSRSVSKDGVPDNAEYDRSRSLSPGEARRRQMELQLGTTKDVPIDDMKYKGTSIPSKSFARLQSQISKSGGEDPSPDPLERLRNKQPDKPDGYIDPDKALEVMQIREHSPEKFFDALENVATGGGAKPQVNGEVKAAGPPKQVKPQTPSTGGIKIISRSISQDAKQQQQQQQAPPRQQPAQQQQPQAPPKQQPAQQQQPQAPPKQQPAQQQQQQQKPQQPAPPPPQQQQVDQANFEEGEDQVTDF